MPRPSRAFRPGSSQLEGRLLLTLRPSAMLPILRGNNLYFAGATMMGEPERVMQDDGSATVYVAGGTNARRARPLPPYQVLVETDPSSPAVGVNVEAVHQILTIGGDNPDTSVTIPLIAGAPNPGEVDVTLTLTPINPPPNLKVGGPLHLQVFASEEFLPPTMGGPHLTSRGIMVGFSKPMDPAGASNVNNYVVTTIAPGGSGSSHNDGWYSFANFFHAAFDKPSSPSVSRVRIKAAQYNPETYTVTLIPRRKIRQKWAAISVTERQTNGASGGKDGSDPGPLLTDLRGQRLAGSIPLRPPAAPPPSPPA